MNTGSRLREALASLGFSIKDAAESAGIPYRSMQNYLRGEREPGAEALKLISEQLGISVDWLLTGEGEMRKGASSPNSVELTPQESALLELFKQLDSKGQREICQDAEEKKRIADLEKQVQELAQSIEQLKVSG